MHLIHRDHNYIYNFCPREGESIAQAWGGLSQCYIHAPIMSSQEKLLFKKFYARLSLNNRSMLDTSCTGSFMVKTIEFKWNLLERIKRNSEDWDLEKVRSQV